MGKQLPESITEDALALAKLLLEFGRVNRVTYHDDGVTLESDTDHTVMLGVMACAFAARYAPHLDLGKVAQFAFVHDLVEVYAGDVATFGLLSPEDKKDKEMREKEALERIKREFDASFPWIGKTIETYEKLDTPEARFVKVFDKTLPKLTHVLNNGVTCKEMGHTKDTAEKFHAAQRESIRNSYGADQDAAMEFLKCVGDAMHRIKYE